MENDKDAGFSAPLLVQQFSNVKAQKFVLMVYKFTKHKTMLVSEDKAQVSSNFSNSIHTTNYPVE